MLYIASSLRKLAITFKLINWLGLIYALAKIVYIGSSMSDAPRNWSAQDLFVLPLALFVLIVHCIAPIIAINIGKDIKQLGKWQRSEPAH